MRNCCLLLLGFAVLCAATALSAQIISSNSVGCTVGPGAGMACNGIGVPDVKGKEKKPARLSVTNYTFRPGAVLERKGSTSDFLIIGVRGGGLLNEKTGSGVSLEKDVVTLLPKEQAFRLINNGKEDLQFRMIEIQR